MSRPVPIVPRISRSEGWWLLLVTLGILLLTLVPPTVERLWGPQDRVHVGTYWYPLDFAVYHSTMREAAESGSWLVHNHLSAEPHEPAFLLPLYVGIGKAAAATGLPLLALYAAAELGGRLVLPLGLYVFAAAFLNEAAARRRAFLLAAFSSGVGGFVLLADPMLNLSPPGRVQPIHNFVEVMTFGSFLAAPHVPLGLAATLTAVIAFGASCQGSRPALYLLAADIIALGLLHPFNLPVLLTAFVLFAALRCWEERRLSPWPALAAAVAIGAGAPSILYNGVTFVLTPFWSETQGAPSEVPSSPPWQLPAQYGVAFVLAPLGAVQLCRQRPAGYQLLLLAVAAGLVWMYAPFGQQRRFAFGLQPELAVLAAAGWPLARQGVSSLLSLVPLGGSARPEMAERVLRGGLYPAAFGGSLMVYLAITFGAATGAEAMYPVDRNTYAVGEWLAAHTGPNDVVAASFNTSNVIGGLVPGRVVLGHPSVTAQAAQKRATMEEIFRGDLSPEETRAFFHANRVSVLIIGPEERRLGPNDPGARWGWPVAMQVGTSIAYRAGESLSGVGAPR